MAWQGTTPVAGCCGDGAATGTVHMSMVTGVYLEEGRAVTGLSMQEAVG
jgi:hypothetical protein